MAFHEKKAKRIMDRMRRTEPYETAYITREQTRMRPGEDIFDTARRTGTGVYKQVSEASDYAAYWRDLSESHYPG